MPDRPELSHTPPQPYPGEEPFPCPACGQMLAPSCRVCVACKRPIDPSEILTLQPTKWGATPAEAEALPRALPPVRFPWHIFFFVLGIWLAVATVVQMLLAPLKAQLVLGGAPILSAGWVFYDALEKGLPKPLRWGLGSLLLWIVVFPWYLARRKKPAAPCPFVEAPVGPLSRGMLFVLLVVLFFLILKGPPPK